jgi:hypothetical protein
VKPFISHLAEFLQRDEAGASVDRATMQAMICDEWDDDDAELEGAMEAKDEAGAEETLCDYQPAWVKK